MAAAGSSQEGGGLSSMMYNWRVKAVHSALEKRGKAEGPLTVEDLASLGHLDQYHYLGTEACDELIEILGLEAGAHVLDVGAGIGGPARYIASKSGCSITGVELQADLASAAADLTARVGLAERVRYLVGDFTQIGMGEELRARFQHLFSLLSFCHFPQRDVALRACFECVQPGGTFLIEDLALVGVAFTEDEARKLREVVSAPSVTSVAAYTAALEAAGFVDVQAVELTAPWKVWTKARHEAFRASKEETVRLHGEHHYEDRVRFYEVVDSLFAGGNLGGARFTGRRPTAAEERLRRGRAATDARHRSGAGAKLNELGSTVGTVAATSAAPASARSAYANASSAAVSTPHLPQPLLPAGPDAGKPQFHDSLQYHFFLPGFFVAGRVFHTSSLQQHSAWMYDISKNAVTELFDPSYEPMVQKKDDGSLHLESAHMRILDTPDGGIFEVKGRGIRVEFKQHHVYSWLPAGHSKESDDVIHRPDLSCKAEVEGKVLYGSGYSKRYWSVYPRFWGYRFIHGVAVAAGESQQQHFWTADAAFGDSKYNYFKVLNPADDSVLSAEADDTWQRDTSAHALVGGLRYRISLSPLCTWNTVIGGPGKSMESKMQNRYCDVELSVGGRTLRGVAYNERCYGTVG